MVFKNVTDLMKRHTALFVILLISQIFTLLSIFFVFGVFQNNLYELCDNHDSKSLEATIDNQKITSDDINIVKYGKRTFRNCSYYRSGDVLFADMEVFKGQGNNTDVLRLI